MRRVLGERLQLDSVGASIDAREMRLGTQCTAVGVSSFDPDRRVSDLADMLLDQRLVFQLAVIERGHPSR